MNHGRAASASVRRTSAICPMHHDRPDRQLLAELQTDNRQPLSAIARKVGSTPSTVQRRLQSLRESGAIREDVAIVNPHVVGRLQTFFVHLTVRSERADLMSVFLNGMRRLPQVQQCYMTTGRSNCIVVLLLPDASWPAPIGGSGLIVSASWVARATGRVSRVLAASIRGRSAGGSRCSAGASPR